MESLVNRLESERAELEALLASEMFGRTNHLARFLTYVCNLYFADATDGIKEYSIAVEALGRPKDFDPQTDTIVRVTAHALRKRLEDYYRTIGAQHPVQICLPSGHYVPKFIHRDEIEPGNGASEGQELLSYAGPAIPAPQDGDAAPEFGLPPNTPLTITADRKVQASPARRSRALMFAALVILAVSAGVFLAGKQWSRKTAPAAATAAATATGNAIHVLVGEHREPYTDRAGFLWQADRFCSGGSSFSVGDRTIRGTDDPALFLGGRSGTFQCRIPVGAGTYELHLLFAETAGLQENARNVVFSINGAPPVSLDVVDDAAGDDVATFKVFAGIQPASDGTIHLDFTSSQSFLNAIEVLPGAADAIQPVRIVTGHSIYRDGQGNVWLPGRYAFGGRLSRYSGDVSKIAEGGLYEWQRIGHFRYLIPVAPGRPYTLKLYFREPWFGAHNGNPGGVGSRIFDVACNGSTLLKNFDILGEAGSEPLIRSFPHIQPTAQGKIEIYFTPVVNYPSVNAIEVIPE